MIEPQKTPSPIFKPVPTSLYIIERSRVKQLVALLSALETLDSLVVHLLGHLLVPQLLLLGFTAVLDALDTSL